jgi:hypothetical protein
MSGEISDVVCDAFGVERGTTVSALMSQMGQQFNVTKKGTP